MTKGIPKISDAEWEIMNVLWSNTKLTANEIIESLNNDRNWSPKTVRTLINRLVEKKAVGYSQEGRLYHYFPLIQEEDCVKHETKTFIHRIYGGAIKPMLVNFLKDERLSKEDIEELRAILDQKEGQES